VVIVNKKNQFFLPEFNSVSRIYFWKV
jgi:hypothetical protein